MQVKMHLHPLVVHRPVPLSAMFALASVQAVSHWKGFEAVESQVLLTHLRKQPNANALNPCNAPFGESRCLVLWGSAGCGASLFSVKIESDSFAIESTALMTAEVDLDQSDVPSVYEASAECFGWTHMPQMRGPWVLIDPICPNDEALAEGLRVDLESSVDLCVSLRLRLGWTELAQLHLLLDSGAEPVRRLLGPDYEGGLDRVIPPVKRPPENSKGSCGEEFWR